MAANDDPTSNEDQPRYPIGSVDRVLRLLLLFRDHPSIRVADATRELDVAGSTAHRLLAMLQLHGFVAQDQKTRRYVPGPAIIELSSAVNSVGDITVLAQDLTRELCEKLDETANFAVLQHTSVVFTAGAESRHVLRIANQTGQRIAAFHSAPGKVMLADLPLEKLRALYPADVIVDPSNGVTVKRTDLEEELAAIRSDGYGTNDTPHTGEAGSFLSLACPIHRDGEVIAAVSVAAPVSRATPSWRDRALEELQRATAAADAQLHS